MHLKAKELPVNKIIKFPMYTVYFFKTTIQKNYIMLKFYKVKEEIKKCLKCNNMLKIFLI